MALRCLAAVAILALFLGGGTAQDPIKLPGQPPRFFTVTKLGKDSVEVTEVLKATKKGTESITYKPALKEIDIFDSKGKKISAEEFHKRVKVGTVVLVAGDEKVVDPAYLSILKDDAVVLGGVLVRVETEPIKPEKK